MGDRLCADGNGLGCFKRRAHGVRPAINSSLLLPNSNRNRISIQQRIARQNMQAYLILANGRILKGKSLGCQGTTVGEVVFATGMVGFEETLTDPSYYGQIITQTYPLIGNYGMNSEDKESGKIWAKGYIKAYAVTGAVDAVTCTEPQCFAPTAGVAEGEEPLHIALLDLGCKKNIVRCLCKRGCRVTVLPASTTLAELKALAPDGLMLSNGPGDPAENVQVIANIRDMLDTGIPAFGICLGHQLTALAAGAKTCKMKYGHRGANQPVTDFALERTFITSQNHGYAVLGDTLPAGTGRVSHVNANDKTCEGIEYLQWNCFTVQFHPEANGGPKDTEFLFDRFLQNVRRINRVKGGR